MFIATAPTFAMEKGQPNTAFPDSLSMAERYIAALARKDANTVVALLSPSAKLELRKLIVLAHPFTEKTPERNANRKKIFGEKGLGSDLTDSEFLLLVLRATLSDDVAQAAEGAKVLGGVRDGTDPDGDDYVICKTPGDSGEVFMVVVKPVGEDRGVSIDGTLSKLMLDLTAQI
jgi:hypothetical protein